MKGEVWLEHKERYWKQSYRNRTCILSGNGTQNLSIPIVNGSAIFPIASAQIDYKTPWQRNHWRSIESAYGNSPYFLYYQDALKPFFEKKFDLLFDFNLQLIKTLLRLMNITCNIQINDEEIPEQAFDLRSAIHPKKSIVDNYPFKLIEPYYQVFEDRFGFTSNLSIIDLLFNLGPDAPAYLRRLLAHYENIL